MHESLIISKIDGKESIILDYKMILDGIFYYQHEFVSCVCIVMQMYGQAHARRCYLEWSCEFHDDDGDYLVSHSSILL